MRFPFFLNISRRHKVKEKRLMEMTEVSFKNIYTVSSMFWQLHHIDSSGSLSSKFFPLHLLTEKGDRNESGWFTSLENVHVFMFSSAILNSQGAMLSSWCWHWCSWHTLNFYDKVFYVMVEALSGKLSCTWTGLVTMGNNFCDFLITNLDKLEKGLWS